MSYQNHGPIVAEISEDYWRANTGFVRVRIGVEITPGQKRQMFHQMLPRDEAERLVRMCALCGMVIERITRWLERKDSGEPTRIPGPEEFAKWREFSEIAKSGF